MKVYILQKVASAENCDHGDKLVSTEK